MVFKNISLNWDGSQHYMGGNQADPRLYTCACHNWPWNYVKCLFNRQQGASLGTDFVIYMKLDNMYAKTKTEQITEHWQVILGFYSKCDMCHYWWKADDFR